MNNPEITLGIQLVIELIICLALMAYAMKDMR
jgi:hypothetical protein